MISPVQRHQLFISYSHADREWVDRLKKMMQPMVRNADLKLWDDSQIRAGARWKEEIEHALSAAKVALLLVSSDFLASDFVNRSELPHILKAAEEEGLHILWVKLRPCLVQRTPINDFQAAIDPVRPLAAMVDWEQEDALAKVAEKIDAVFQEARKEEQERQEAERLAREEEERQQKKAEHQQKLQRELELCNEDVANIEEPLLAPKQADYQRKQVEEPERQRQETERKAESDRRESERLAREQQERQRQTVESPAIEPDDVVSAGEQTFSLWPLQPIATTHGWLVKEAGGWQVKSKPQAVQGYQEELTPGVAITMLRIPAATFLMGSPESEEGRSNDEAPQHEVSMKEFFMAQTTITQKQWRVVAGWEKVERELNPDPSRFKGPDRPVEKVSWHDAVEFCRRLTKRRGKRYGLPSEAQWEFACRAGTTTPFHFGETLTAELANYDGNDSYGNGPKGTYREKTTDVGSFPANAWGLQDMHGNVWEWCEDQWHDSYAGAPKDGSPWLNSSAGADESRLLRGGSWFSDPWLCRSAYRHCVLPVSLYGIVGFRVCALPPGLPS